VALFAFLTAASNPVAGVLVLLLGFDYICHKALRKRVLVVSVGLFVGMVFSLFVQINQEPPLRYLGEWTQELAQTSETLGRLEDSGAATVRKAPPIDVIEVVKSSPATIKYLLTQMMPEPYASRWILTQQPMVNLIQVGILALLFGGVPLYVLYTYMKSTRTSFIFKSFLRLTIVFVSVVFLQALLISGVVQTRQFLFAPICIYWVAAFLLVPQSLSPSNKQMSIGLFFISLFLGVFIPQALQNFRDPFDSNPRQGGMGRYEEDPLWILALSRALGECQNMQPDDIVIISQKEEIRFDSPVVIRCKFITR
jgi:hypothetical protein